MKIKDVRKMLKGLNGELDCEFQISYDCDCGCAGCENVELNLEEKVKDGKVVTVAIFRG